MIKYWGVPQGSAPPLTSIKSLIFRNLEKQVDIAKIVESAFYDIFNTFLIFLSKNYRPMLVFNKNNNVANLTLLLF